MPLNPTPESRMRVLYKTRELQCLHPCTQQPKSLALPYAQLDSSKYLFQSNFIPMNSACYHFIHSFTNQFGELFILCKETEQYVNPQKPRTCLILCVYVQPNYANTCKSQNTCLKKNTLSGPSYITTIISRHVCYWPLLYPFQLIDYY